MKTKEKSEAIRDGETQHESARLVRLNKFIANSGYSARRKVDELIETGRVTVNMVPVTSLGIKIDPENDTVKIDGELVKVKSKFLYILLNKPKEYITTTADERNRPIVTELINLKERLYPVGRLDYQTEGLLLMTNDGDLANRLMHPKYGVNKTYHVKLSKAIDEVRVNKLKAGIKIDGRRTSEADVTVIPDTHEHELLITIHEGRNRQIRKMVEAMGLFVRKLKRIEYAGLKIEDLKSGSWRYLNATEVADLKKQVSKEVITEKPVEKKAPRRIRRTPGKSIV